MSVTDSTLCEYCAINCRPLVWEPHDMYAYVNKIHVDGPRIDVDIYDEDGRHIRAHVPIERCPMCGEKLRKEDGDDRWQDARAGKWRQGDARYH